MAKVSNAQVRHVFAQGSRGEAENGERTFFCNSDTLWSYSTPIAKWHPTPSGQRVVLITSDGYSPTTRSKQLSGLSLALGLSTFLYVPYVGEVGGKAPDTDWRQINHEGNIEWLREQLETATGRAKRSKTQPEWNISDMRRAADALNKYLNTFDLEGERADGAALEAEVERWLEIRDLPEGKAISSAERKAAAARRAAERQAAEERERAAAIIRANELSQQRREWLAGDLRGTVGGPVMFRMKADGETVQTSLGAEVPIGHAIRAFKFVKWVRMSGQRWQKNGHRVPVGHFEVDSIEPNGDFKAGCHSITWAEVERFARHIGVFDEAASTVAEIQTE
jgi:hypothetical protein